MRERFADHLAEIERQIEAALQNGATLSLVAQAVLKPSGEDDQGDHRGGRAAGGLKPQRRCYARGRLRAQGAGRRIPGW